uniref:Chaoptin n=1 Tax=Setaria digitata TaxID=48799 RepID=A0A915PH04_9BILA
MSVYFVEPKKLPVCLSLFNIITVARAIFVQSSGIFAEQECLFDPTPNSIWKTCNCENLDGEGNIHVKCRRQSWTIIPTIPYDNRSLFSHNDTVYNIVALSIMYSGVTFINQDAFKHHNIQILDLTNNHIETINVNAFRGLENKLYQLKLNQNSLTSIPSWAMTYLYQLQYLHLVHNMISEIKSDTFDETQLKNLHYLHLDYNQISILPKKSLLRLPLQVLTLSNNRISEIEKLALPTTVWFLDLKNNLIPEIPYLALRELEQLRTLDLESNNITEITNNPEVEFISEIDLKLSNNRIRHINDNAFNSFRKFGQLDLSYNQISTISGSAFNSISQMRQIDLSYNRIVHIPAGTFKNVAKSLRWMNLEENQLHQLPNALQPLRTLEILNMNGNKLTALDNNIVNNLKPVLTELLLAFNRLTEIPTQVLDGMSRLRHLDLSKNRIRHMQRLAFGKFDGTGTSLLKLNLAGNMIENITDPGAFLYMSSLAYLDLSHNRISYLNDNAFERLESLESLFLQSNQLDQFPTASLSNLKRLRYLLLDDNPIRILPNSALHGLQYLERLSLTRTKLQYITERTFPGYSAPNLRSLNLAFGHINHISTGAFSSLNSLEQLTLNNNRLTNIQTMTFSSLRNLRQLNLAGNAINITMERSISDIPTLENLSLARNRLEQLSKATFVNLHNLEQLDLSHNQLRTFDFTFLAQSLVNVKQLDLSHNHIITIDLNSAKRTLMYLNLAHNQLQSIGKNMLHDFGQLKVLKLSHNELIEVQSNAFTTCTLLNELDLSHNHLRILHKGTFTKQKIYDSLSLQNNAIISLDMDTFGDNNVHELDLAYNELKKIPQHAFSSIQNSLIKLNLKGNRIRSINTDDFDGMENLMELVLADNHIETIEEAAFSKMQKLIKLDVSHNPITSWNPHAFQGLSHAIETLDLANTGLFSLPKIDNHGLRLLNISNNKIHEVNAAQLHHNRKLTTLDISYNNFKELDPGIFAELVELKHLNVTGNPVIKFTDKLLQSLYNLETLRICDMKELLRLPEPHSFRNLRHLRNFYIYNLPNVQAYNISDMLKYLPPLRILAIEIREARLTTQLYGADFRLLRKIVIMGKHLLKIDTGAFAQLRGYKVDLTIRDSRIDVFPSSAFNTLTAVSFLSLSLQNNQLQTFEPFPHTKPPVLNQHGTILHNLQLTGNPIICDCRLNWIGEWIEYYQSVNAAYEQPLSDTRCAHQAGGGATLHNTYASTNRIVCTMDGVTDSCNSISIFSNFLPPFLLIIYRNF